MYLLYFAPFSQSGSVLPYAKTATCEEKTPWKVHNQIDLTMLYHQIEQLFRHIEHNLSPDWINSVTRLNNVTIRLVNNLITRLMNSIITRLNNLITRWNNLITRVNKMSSNLITRLNNMSAPDLPILARENVLLNTKWYRIPRTSVGVPQLEKLRQPSYYCCTYFAPIVALALSYHGTRLGWRD